MEIRLAGAQDIDAWMALVEQARYLFPGLETAGAMAEHRATVLHFVQKASAVCAIDEGRILGRCYFQKKIVCYAFWWWTRPAAGSTLGGSWCNLC